MDYFKTPNPDKPRKDVLVVDDDEGVQILMGEVLSAMGLTHDSATSGKEGFTKAMENQYRVILMDLRMEGWDGLETIQSLEECNEQSSVLVLSAYLDDQVREELQRHPIVAGIMEKPFATEDLKNRVTELLEASEDA